MNIYSITSVSISYADSSSKPYRHEEDLDSNLGSAPVSSLSIVSDCIIGSKTNPWSNRSVLLGLFGQLLLQTKSLLGWLQDKHTRRRKFNEEANHENK